MISVFHIAVCRKSLEGTVAQNVSKYGVGGLNIDGCRVVIPKGDSCGGGALSANDRGQVLKFGLGGYDGKQKENTQGRFPANLILVHNNDCVCVGTRKVKASGHWNKSRGKGGLSTSGHGGQEGLEERFDEGVIENWECSEGCPVRVMDEQSGNRPGMSGGGQKGNNKDASWIVQDFNRKTVKSEWVRGDSGGASRFFKRIVV